MTELAQRTPMDASVKLARRFVLVSLVYFIIGTTWMGPLSFLLSGPSGTAGDLYDTGRWHLVFIGFLAFAVMGMIYYLVPKIGGRQLYSKRLASIHFWMTNVLLPIGVVIEVSAAYAFQSFINSTGGSTSNLPPGLMVFFVLILVVFFAGIGAQGVFAYNIYKTVKA